MKICISDIARSAAWPRVKAAGEVVIEVDGTSHRVALAEQRTAIGVLRYLRCPRCEARRRTLQVAGDELVCGPCLGHRHPDQRLPDSRWAREVVRPSRQLARVEARLSRPGPDRNTRRRLRRRRARLVARLKAALAARRSGFAARTAMFSEIG